MGVCGAAKHAVATITAAVAAQTFDHDVACPCCTLVHVTGLLAGVGGYFALCCLLLCLFLSYWFGVLVLSELLVWSSGLVSGIFTFLRPSQPFVVGIYEIIG